MKINGPCFTGGMLVEGNPRDLNSIKREILKRAFKIDKKVDFEAPTEEVFEYQNITHENRWSTRKRTDLHLSKNDVKQLNEYYLALKPIFDRFNNPSNMTSSIENPGALNGLTNAIDNFCRENISKYVKIPEKTYNAKDVLSAIRQNKFDFPNLRIIYRK